MALTLKFQIQNDCSDELIFTENTGAYNNPDNLTGWGSPNYDLGQVDSSILVITNLTTNVTYDGIDITPSDVVGTQTIIDVTTLAVAGVNQALTSLPDGIYTYTWTIVINTGTSFPEVEQEITQLSLCQIACKIKVLASRIDLSCGCCHDDCSKSVWKFLEAYTLYKALLFGGACGSISEVNENIRCLQDFLRNINCQTC